MNPRPTDSRYVSANGPVNRRTMRAHDAEPPPPPPSLAAARHAKTQARALLGVPLADRVLAAQPVRAAATPGAPVGAANVALALLAAGSGSGVVLGALQTSLPLLAIGGAGLAAAAFFGALGWRRRRQAAFGAAGAPIAAPSFDADALRRLDDLLEAVAPDVSAQTCAQLVEMKDRFARIAGLLARTGLSEQFTADDRMYLLEALRRYLPDTLLAYQEVPTARRHDRPLDGGQTAAALLTEQLALLQSELRAREEKMTSAAGAALLRQQRFLQSKASRRGE